MRLSLYFIILFLAAAKGFTATDATDSENTSETGSQLSTTAVTHSTSQQTGLYDGWSGAIVIGQTENLYRTGSGLESASFDMAARLSKVINSDLSLTGTLERSFDSKSQSATWVRGYLTGSFQPRSLSDNFRLTPSFTFGVPVSAADQDRSFRGRLTAKAKIDILPPALRASRFAISYSPALTYNHFAYQTSSHTGAVNSPLLFASQLDLAYEIDSRWSVGMTALHILRRSMFGSTRETIAHYENVSWQALPNLGLAIGHLYGNPETSIRRPNGTDYNFALTSEADSFVYGEATFSF